MQPTQPQPDPHREALDELVAIGVTLARHLQAQVTAPYPILHDYAAESFERISRAVRRTILLARRLESHPEQPPTPQGRDPRSKRDGTQNPESQDPESHPDSNPESRPESSERLDTPDRPDSNDDGNDATADEQALANLTLPQALAAIRRDLDPATHPNHDGTIPYDPARPPCRTRPSARNYPPITRKKGAPLYPPIRPRRPNPHRHPPPQNPQTT